MLEINDSKEKRFILASSFRGLISWLLGPFSVGQKWYGQSGHRGKEGIEIRGVWG
jgi:hypothetical protein